MDIQGLEQIELEEEVAFSFKPETGTIGVKGKATAVDRALERIKDHRDGVLELLRQRQGVLQEREEDVEREIAVNVPSLAVQRENYITWFTARSKIYHPSAAELDCMFAAVSEGDEIIFDFAQSFTVRRPNGLLVQIDRKGRVSPPSPYSPALRGK